IRQPGVSRNNILTEHRAVKFDLIIESWIYGSIRKQPDKMQAIGKKFTSLKQTRDQDPSIWQRGYRACLAPIDRALKSGIQRTIGMHAEDPVHRKTLLLRTQSTGSDEFPIGKHGKGVDDRIAASMHTRGIE